MYYVLTVTLKNIGGISVVVTREPSKFQSLVRFQYPAFPPRHGWQPVAEDLDCRNTLAPRRCRAPRVKGFEGQGEITRGLTLETVKEQRRQWDEERDAREAFSKWVWEVGVPQTTPFEAVRAAFIAGFQLGRSKNAGDEV